MFLVLKDSFGSLDSIIQPIRKTLQEQAFYENLSHLLLLS